MKSSMRGARTASVFPLARGADITRFSPARTGEMASFCTGVRSGKRAKKGVQVNFRRFLQSSDVSKVVTHSEKILFSQIGVVSQEIKGLDGSLNEPSDIVPPIPKKSFQKSFHSAIL